MLNVWQIVYILYVFIMQVTEHTVLYIVLYYVLCEDMRNIGGGWRACAVCGWCFHFQEPVCIIKRYVSLHVRRAVWRWWRWWSNCLRKYNVGVGGFAAVAIRQNAVQHRLKYIFARRLCQVVFCVYLFSCCVHFLGVDFVFFFSCSIRCV